MLLLTVMAVPLLYMARTDLRIWQLRWQRDSRLAQSRSIITIRLRTDAVVWVHAREIVVNNRLFDIRHKTEKDGWLTVTGHYDDPETKLMKQQSRAQEKNKTATLVNILKALHQLYCSASESVPVTLPYTTVYPDARRYTTPAPLMPVFTPPPRSCFFS